MFSNTRKIYTSSKYDNIKCEKRLQLICAIAFQLANFIVHCQVSCKKVLETKQELEALETQMGNVTTTLHDLALQMQQHAQQMQQQSVILTELSKQISQKGVSPEGETSVGDSTQNESRLAGKKVKLPVFEGEDPVAWIMRAEIYFDVQNTPDEMRVKPSSQSKRSNYIVLISFAGCHCC